MTGLCGLTADLLLGGGSGQKWVTGAVAWKDISPFPAPPSWMQWYRQLLFCYAFLPCCPALEPPDYGWKPLQTMSQINSPLRCEYWILWYDLSDKENDYDTYTGPIRFSFWGFWKLVKAEAFLRQHQSHQARLALIFWFSQLLQFFPLSLFIYLFFCIIQDGFFKARKLLAQSRQGQSITWALIGSTFLQTPSLCPKWDLLQVPCWRAYTCEESTGIFHNDGNRRQLDQLTWVDPID